MNGGGGAMIAGGGNAGSAGAASFGSATVGGGGAVPAKVPFADTTKQTLDEIATLADANNDRLQGLLDRAFGPESVGGSGGGKGAPPPGALGAINTSLQELRDMLERQRAMIGRLEGIV